MPRTGEIMKMNSEVVRRMHESIGVESAKSNLDKYGYVATALMVFNDKEMLSIMDGGEGPPEVIGNGAMRVPGSLRDNQGLIKFLIDANGYTTAVTVGEYWTYPEESSRADYEKFLAEGGPAPSDHPGRVEGVFVVTMSPVHRVNVATTFGIDRSGEKPELIDPKTVDESQSGSMITGWLEELLPQGSKT